MLAALLAFAAMPVVCIDPGHPSEVGRGTSGKKISELTAVWRVAKELEPLLKKSGIKVVLTKKREEEFVKNRRRAEIANKAKADLLLRLHCDAAEESGFGTYFPSQAGKAQGRTGPSPLVIRESGIAAKAFHPAAMKVLATDLNDRGLMTDLQTAVGRKQGALTGSIFSQVPVILLEMAVLNDPKDDAFMASKAGQKKMAQALHAGCLAALRTLKKLK